MNRKISIEVPEGAITIVIKKKVLTVVTCLILICGVSFGISKVSSVVVAKNILNRPTCHNFATWQAAQNAYNADKVKYKSLDRNNDGVACEIMKKLESK